MSSTLIWYGGFFVYFMHDGGVWLSLAAALLLGTGFAFGIGIVAVFFSGEWIK